MGYTPMELAEVFLKTGELEDALDALNQQLVNVPDDSEALRLRASVYLRLPTDDNLQHALSDLNCLPELSASDLVQKSLTYERMGNHGESLAAMTDAIEKAPKDERIVERYVTLLIANGDIETAYKTIIHQARTWRWLQWEADVLIMLGDYDRAIQKYGLALSQMDGRNFLKSNQTIQAIRGRMLIARAHAYREIGKYHDAESHYQMALDCIANDPMIAFNLGVLYALKGDMSIAVEKCEEAFSEANETLKQVMVDTLAQDERLTDLKRQLNYH